MGITADEVDLVLKADTDGYIAALVRADAKFAAVMANLEKDANAAGAEFTRLGDRIQNTLSKISDKTINANLNVRDNFDTAGRGQDIDAYGQELDALRAKFNPLFAAQQHYEANLKEIAAAERVGAISAQEAAAAASSAASRYEATSAAIGRAGAAAQAAGGKIKSFGNQGANVASQFNDIAVQLQSGQSPFIIALQQGTQLNQTLGLTNGGGVRGALAGLAEGFSGLLNPVGLATIAVIALGGAAVQWLTSAAASAGDATDAIKKHAEAIQEIVKGYDEASQAADDYLKEAQRLPQGKAIEAVAVQAGQLRTELDAINAKLASFGANAQGGILQKSIGELVDKFREGKITAGDLKAQLDAMKVDPRNAGLVKQLAQSLDDAAVKAAQLSSILFDLNFIAADLAKNFGVQFALDEKLKGFTDAVDKIKGLTPELRTQREIVDATYNDGLKNAITASQREELKKTHDMAIAKMAESDARDAAKKATDDAQRASDQAAKKLESERQAVIDLIDTLRFENGELGKSAEQQAVDAALRRTGAAATGEQRTEIESLTRANFETAAAQKEAAAELDNFLNIGQSGVQSFINDILDGKSAVESLDDALKNIGGQLINSGLGSLFSGTGPLASLFNGGGGISAGAGIAGGALPARASGGPVRAGKTYMVGENGPEPFTPGVNGMISPNRGNNSSIVFAPNVSMPGADTEAVARMETVLRNMAAEFVPRVRKEIQNKGRSW